MFEPSDTALKRRLLEKSDEIYDLKEQVNAQKAYLFWCKDTNMAKEYKSTICLDFDGVINSYSKWFGDDCIPDPIVKGAKEFINEAKREYKVCIFTTRAKTENGKVAVKKYLESNGVDTQDMEITATKPPAIVYIDDRAICFTGTFDGLLEKIKSFKPWNRK